ncbi:hypothetical protein CLV78_1114 [Aliiruegeria haliotis]|uniref:Uncharacterized protein n=1 Tax=Aliiruegeria haliotis TaxID=1280846 RepID=A0A2T0RI96_9RHOB|nr:hypothetical protein [Aliiruegeria haliotis]PRY20851.1 hypothetical protein CLV78_1114 [Aliiruegeria haliotis]
MAVFVQNMSEQRDDGATLYQLGIASRHGRRDLLQFYHVRQAGLAACLRAAADAVDAADPKEIAEPRLTLEDLMAAEQAAALLRGSESDD